MPGSWPGRWRSTWTECSPCRGRLAVGVERLDVRLVQANGTEPPDGEVLVRSTDGLVSIAGGIARVWPDAELGLHESPEARQAAGAKQLAFDSAWADGFLSVRVPVVKVPWPADAGLAEVALTRLREVVERLGQAPAARRLTDEAEGPQQAGAREQPGALLADLFPAPDYEVRAEFRSVRAERHEGLSAGAPLRVQESADVPLGGGVLAALADRQEGLDPASAAADLLTAAMRAGGQVARRYAGRMPSAARAREPGEPQALVPGWDARDAVVAAEVMALTFLQYAGNLGESAVPVDDLAVWLPLVSRAAASEDPCRSRPAAARVPRRRRGFHLDDGEERARGLVPEVRRPLPRN